MERLPAPLRPERFYPKSQYAVSSAFGTKRTSGRAQSMSAFGGKADMTRTCADVCLTQSGHSVLRVIATQNDGGPHLLQLSAGCTQKRRTCDQKSRPPLASFAIDK